MKSKKRRLRSSKFYLVLDKGSLKHKDPVKTAQEALDGGVDIIQLRDKNSCDAEIIEYGKKLKNIARSRSIPFIIDDRPDICKILDADGVHIGQSDVPIRAARSILGRNKIIGVSCHSLKEALKAASEGADYIAIGPIFKSPTKPKLRPRGLGLLKEVAGKVKIPIVAIGGIDKSSIGKVAGCGANIIAIVSAILKKKNIRRAASELKEEIYKAENRK